ncbi:hypothetical protein BDB01DRAFT_851257 [Pilobolus umbonatus]|nr:hypothetical protein BDB01DRAFT_851257 [Pilobolus umbonatus]
MVPNQLPLHRNPNSSLGHSSMKSKRTNSIQPERTLSPQHTTASANPRPISVNNRHSRSVSSNSAQLQLSSSIRKHSSPAQYTLNASEVRAHSEVPQLSIADRFMSTGYQDVFPSEPLSQLNQHKKSSPSISTSNSLVLSNSAISDTPTGPAGVTKLSVADRFMYQSSPANSIVNMADIQRERSPSSFSGKTLDTRSSVISPSLPNTDPVPGRLTIADTFMRSSTIPSEKSKYTPAGDIDLGYSYKMKDSKEGYNSKSLDALYDPYRASNIFDSQYLNLDLSLASSAASSVMNSNRASKPWESQETLVIPDKKKPIYAQFIESEKNATISYGNTYLDSNQPVFATDYFVDPPDHTDRRTIALSDDISTKHGYDEYDDMEVGYEKSKYQDYYNGQDWDYHDEAESVIVGKEKERPLNKHDEERHNASRASSRKQVRHLEGDCNTQGFWVGCCFVSCGKRPTSQTIEKRKKDSRERDTEHDVRPTHRGFGRRGWVFCSFISLIITVLAIYFLWPRTPLMRIEGADLTKPAQITQTKQGIMVGNVAFESEWMVNITVDNRQNHVPTRLVKVQVLAKDALTGMVIGKGLHDDESPTEHIILAPNVISTIQIPIHIDYQARDNTDTTFVDLTKSCSPQNSIAYSSDSNALSHQRESLPLHFWITLHIFGLDWLGYKPTVIATPATGGFACPQS